MANRYGSRMSKYDSHNIHGAVICNAFGCRKHKCLSKFAGAMWCKTHVNEIIQLRNIIGEHRGDQAESEARLTEIRLRKDFCGKHCHYAAMLEKKFTS